MRKRRTSLGGWPASAVSGHIENKGGAPAPFRGTFRAGFPAVFAECPLVLSGGFNCYAPGMDHPSGSESLDARHRDCAFLSYNHRTLKLSARPVQRRALFFLLVHFRDQAFVLHAPHVRPD